MKTGRDGRAIAKVSRVTAGVINGTEDLSTWSDEELERGQRRGKDGRFRRPPLLVAKAVHDELVRRRMSKAYDLLRESTYDAVAVLRSIAIDTEADPSVRVKAAELILDRALGKAPQHLSLDVGEHQPWQKLVASSIVGDLDGYRALVAEQNADAEIVEGEIVEGEAE